ncbi:hypothetical protein [Cognatishimia sp. MH4019]|uniref:hypothetical protein n=1 Tax=Cognatishimia sp. MH4019 TaxID=2854030 RepID=UPI001CD1DA21|nr:hypothetical protein [Cognatishimia sp. MH4019]
MSSKRTEISELIYNPVETAFEAIVTIHDGPVTARYAASLKAPLNASFETISAGMIARAHKQHRSETPGLRTRLLADGESLPVPRAHLAPLKTMLDSLFARAA